MQKFNDYLYLKLVYTPLNVFTGYNRIREIAGVRL